MKKPRIHRRGALGGGPSSLKVFQDFFVRQGLQEKRIDLAQYVDFSLDNSVVQ